MRPLSRRGSYAATAATCSTWAYQTGDDRPGGQNSPSRIANGKQSCREMRRPWPVHPSAAVHIRMSRLPNGRWCQCPVTLRWRTDLLDARTDPPHRQDARAPERVAACALAMLITRAPESGKPTPHPDLAEVGGYAPDTVSSWWIPCCLPTRREPALDVAGVLARCGIRHADGLRGQAGTASNSACEQRGRSGLRKAMTRLR